MDDIQVFLPIIYILEDRLSLMRDFRKSQVEFALVRKCAYRLQLRGHVRFELRPDRLKLLVIVYGSQVCVVRVPPPLPPPSTINGFTWQAVLPRGIRAAAVAVQGKTRVVAT